MMLRIPTLILFVGLIVSASVAAAVGIPDRSASPNTPVQTVNGTGAFGLFDFLKRTPEVAFPEDKAFDRYCDLRDLSRAVAQMDAEAATDVALQLLHGESILLRPRHGASARDVADIAVRLATAKGDTASLKRLKGGAEKAGDGELAARLDTQVKLAATARDDTPPLAVSSSDLSVEQFEIFHAVSKGMRAAAIAGDEEYAKQITDSVASESKLTTKQKEQLIAYCRANTPRPNSKTPNPVLQRLSQAARNCDMDGSWQTEYQTVDGDVVQAAVEIQGTEGSYTVPGCQGRLYNIRAAAPLGGGSMVVTGNWQFCGGETGTFRWSVDGDSFRGNWAFSSGAPRPYWNGSRSGGGGEFASGGGGGEIDGGGGETDGGGFVDGSGEIGGGYGGSGDGDLNPDVDGGGSSGGSELSPGDGDGLEAFLGSTMEADNGSSISLKRDGTAILANRAGMRLPGRIVMRNDGTATATFGKGWASIRVLNADQIQVGPTIFTRR